jgi:hypothetical protein
MSITPLAAPLEGVQCRSPLHLVTDLLQSQLARARALAAPSLVHPSSSLICCRIPLIGLLVTMSAAYHGGLEGADQYVKQEALGAAISKAMDWWFTRDITNIACLDFGGSSPCPCSDTDTTLWNTNWFSNVRNALRGGLKFLTSHSPDYLDSEPCGTDLPSVPRKAH